MTNIRSTMFVAALSLLPIPAGANVDPSSPNPPREVLDAIPIVLLVDLDSGQVLYARQPDLKFVPASVAKVMSAYVAFEEMAKGRLKPTTPILVRPETAAAWNGKGTSLYLEPGISVTADLLLRGITTVSANDGAMVLAEGYSGSVAGWTSLMNAHARALGMKSSHFAMPNGWPDSGRTYVSANDLVRLASALIERHPVLYRRYFGQRTLTYGGRTQANHDPVSGVVPGADGIKTGYTREAGYNFLGSAERDGRRLALVLAGATSEEQRATAARALLEYGYYGFRKLPLFPKDAILGRVRVQGGAAREVPLVARDATYLLEPPNRTSRLSLAISYHGPLLAPIRRGQHVADLTIIRAGMPKVALPLYASKSVDRAGPLDRLWNGLAGLLS